MTDETFKQRLSCRASISAVNKVCVAVVLSGALTSIPDRVQAADTATLEEVVVTARRRAELLEEVPLSVTALQGDTITDAGIANMQEFGQLVAGANFTRVGAQVKPAIRGVTSLTSGWTYENGVAVYIDGFYSPDPYSTGTDLSNIKSIQVLKGPQGTLYGRNAMAGAIVIETLDPSDELTAKGSISYGRYEDIRTEGYVSFPISDTVGVSVMGYRRENDGYMRDIGDDPLSKSDDFDAAPVEQSAVRAKLKFTPSDSFNATLGYSYTYSDVPVGLLFHPFRNLNANPNPLNTPPERAIGKFEVSQSIKTQNAVKVKNYTAKMAFHSDFGTLTSYSGWNRRESQIAWDFDGSKQVSYQAKFPWDRNTGRTFQQTFDYAVNAGDRLDLILGAFYYRDELVTGSNDFAGTDVFPFRQTETRMDSDAYAGYIEASYALTEQLFLTAGARYNEEKREVDYVAGYGPRFGASETFDDVTMNANVRYELAPATNVYVSYSEGFRSGAFSGSPPANPIDPENIESYEIGFKTVKDAWRLDAAAYFYDYTNLQVATIQPDPSCTLAPVDCPAIAVTSNADSAEGYGSELQLTWTPFEGMNIRAGLAYSQAEYTDFKNAVGTEFDATGATNLGDGRNVSGQKQDWSDQEMANAPEWTGNIGFDYSFGLAGGEMFITSNASYSSSFVSRDPSLWGESAVPLANPNEQRFRSGSYTLVNAQAKWTEPDGHYSLAVYCNNCTDTEFVNYYSGGSFGDYRLFNEPVTYGVRLDFNY